MLRSLGLTCRCPCRRFALRLSGCFTNLLSVSEISERDSKKKKTLSRAWWFMSVSPTITKHHKTIEMCMKLFQAIRSHPKEDRNLYQLVWNNQSMAIIPIVYHSLPGITRVCLPSLLPSAAFRLFRESCLSRWPDRSPWCIFWVKTLAALTSAA